MKFYSISYATDQLGNSYIQESMATYFSLSVSETIDIDALGNSSARYRKHKFLVMIDQ